MTFKTEPGGLGDKFRLLYTVATDERASRSHAAVMAVILWRYNRANGCCWPSIESIAENASLDTRTAQRALDALEGWGFLHTVRNRGKLNRYVPHFQAQREPGSNGAHAGGEGRHARPRGTTSASQSNGAHAVTPTAPTPPEYLNESIPESKKEKEERFSFEGNRERAGGGRRELEAPGKKQERSPEEYAAVLLSILESRRTVFGMPHHEYEAELGKVEASYRDRCDREGRPPHADMLAKIRPDVYGPAKS